MSNKDFEKFLFNQGTNYYSYKYLGAHPENDEYTFRVWAPSAQEVYVVGDFCDWEHGIKMNCDDGIWSASVDKNRVSWGMKYKFIICRDGRRLYKADPYAFYSEMEK